MANICENQLKSNKVLLKKSVLQQFITSPHLKLQKKGKSFRLCSGNKKSELLVSSLALAGASIIGELSIQIPSKMCTQSNRGQMYGDISVNRCDIAVYSFPRFSSD